MPKVTRSPHITLTAFDCPHCGAFAKQSWFYPLARPLDAPPQGVTDREARIHDGAKNLFVLSTDSLAFTTCANCNKVCIWRGIDLIDPRPRLGIEPNPDLPADVVQVFNEARDIVSDSPRGAAALLRLALQMLCLGELKAEGKTIDENIASLVKRGLPQMISQALDIVRVIGNEAVHPGTIDLKDDVDTATELFRLVNIIADQLITNPKNVREFYATLPEGKRKAIETRNSKALDASKPQP